MNQVVHGYLSRQLPLDIVVCDMEWHDQVKYPNCDQVSHGYFFFSIALEHLTNGMLGFIFWFSFSDTLCSLFVCCQLPFLLVHWVERVGFVFLEQNPLPLARCFFAGLA